MKKQILLYKPRHYNFLYSNWKVFLPLTLLAHINYIEWLISLWHFCTCIYYILVIQNVHILAYSAPSSVSIVSSLSRFEWFSIVLQISLSRSTSYQLQSPFASGAGNGTQGLAHTIQALFRCAWSLAIDKYMLFSRLLQVIQSDWIAQVSPL